MKKLVFSKRDRKLAEELARRLKKKRRLLRQAGELKLRPLVIPDVTTGFGC